MFDHTRPPALLMTASDGRTLLRVPAVSPRGALILLLGGLGLMVWGECCEPPLPPPPVEGRAFAPCPVHGTMTTCDNP